MNNYKATPEQWEYQERWASSPVLGVDSSCFLELRARVMALEAQANHFVDVPKMVPPPVVTDEELQAIWDRSSGFEQALHAIYDLGVEHGQAGSREVAEPVPIAGGLVERISYEIRIGRTTLRCDEATAVSAILEVARWMRSELVSREIAERLEQEAGR